MYVSASRGVTLIDTLVSTMLMVIVFVGIAGVFQLLIDVIGNNRARAGAVALANEQQEKIRSLEYDAVGTLGGVPAGALPQSESLTLNGFTYTRRTIIVYKDDPKDGSGVADSAGGIADYKAAKVEVSWTARKGGDRSLSVVSRISPPGLESTVPGGSLAITVVGAGGQPIEDAQVSIVNGGVAPAVNTVLYTDASGFLMLIGVPPGTGYVIMVTKAGHNSAQTYDVTAQNTNPSPGHLTASLNQTTAATFAIDTLATKHVRTYRPIRSSVWTDSLDDDSKLTDMVDVVVSGSVLQLAGSSGTYSPSGSARSVALAPADLARWREFDWNDTVPVDTAMVYHVYDGTGATLVPDSMISGNSTGFTSGPIDLSGVSTSTFSSLSVSASLSTSDATKTPHLDSWTIEYDYGPTPLPNIVFSMRGTKTIGSGPSGTIYGYDVGGISSGAAAGVIIPNLAWDTYEITVDGASIGYDISSSCSSQPQALSPGSYQETSLYFTPHTSHSLLVDVKNSGGTAVSGASVRLYRGAYDTTIASDTCGQSFFSGVSQGTTGGGNPYSIEVSAPGYTTYTATDVTVSAASRLSVVLP